MNVGGFLSTYALHSLTATDIHSWNGHFNSSYFQPLGPSSFMHFGCRITTSASRTSALNNQSDSAGEPSLNTDSLFQIMVLRSLIEDFHAGYTGKLHHLDITADLSAQSGMLNGIVGTMGTVTSYRYNALLPNVQGGWQVGINRRLNINMSRQTNLPSLSQLDPFMNLSNPQYPITGNPGLRASYSDNLAVHYEQSSLHRTQFFGFGGGLAFTTTNHTIIQDISAPKTVARSVRPQPISMQGRQIICRLTTMSCCPISCTIFFVST